MNRAVHVLKQALGVSMLVEYLLGWRIMRGLRRMQGKGVKMTNRSSRECAFSHVLLAKLTALVVESAERIKTIIIKDFVGARNEASWE